MFSRNTHRFPGGIHPPGHKALSNAHGIDTLPLPNTLYLPLRQHAGAAAIPVVQPGERVFKGQLLARAAAPVSAALHAPTSGVLRDIVERPVAHPSGLNAACLVIDIDGIDETSPAETFAPWDPSQDVQTLIERIHAAGIVGLGGAAFPAAVKMQTRKENTLDTLLINGAECEPYITCDDLLMQTEAPRIWQGIHLLCRILQPRQCVLAIEDNKPQAIRAMRTALQHSAERFPCHVRVQIVPTRYPTGGEKQLIKVVTGREVQSGRLPLHVGVVCQNVATARAIADALLDGTPLISRLVTVTGDGVRRPGNYRVLLGTPVRDLIEHCGGLSDGDVSLTMGGPMMGLRLHNRDVPVVKGMNCLLVRKVARKHETVLACIRCGQCARVCPVSLLPQQLYRFARAREFDKATDHALRDCIECGCCEYVCPSHIPLVQYYRYAKAEIQAQQQDKQKSDAARQRHQRRLQRIEMEQAGKRQKPRRSATESPTGTPQEAPAVQP